MDGMHLRLQLGVSNMTGLFSKMQTIAAKLYSLLRTGGRAETSLAYPVGLHSGNEAAVCEHYTNHTLSYVCLHVKNVCLKA